MKKKVIDISGYQEGINWDAVVAAGVEGVIIKISEGCSVENTWWNHLANAEAKGLPWGVYCYGHAQTPERGRAEANEVLYLLQNRITPMFIWYDVEDDDMFAAGVDTTAVASAFVAACNEAGYPCGIYTSSLKCTDYMVNSLRPRLWPITCRGGLLTIAVLTGLPKHTRKSFAPAGSTAHMNGLAIRKLI